MLIIFGGLPGTGKTTLAKAVAKALSAVYLRIDTIEEAIRSCDVLTEDVGSSGYVVAYNLAAENLRLGGTVVTDSVNPLTVTRDSWMEAAIEAGCAAVEIEVICSDVTEHRRRLVGREAVVEETKRLTWEKVATREYDEWTRTRVVVDTAKMSVEEATAELLRILAA
jgi:predicted kinase